MKITRLICYFFCFTLFSGQLSAQDATTHKNEMSYTLGTNFGYFKDQNFSPLNYSIFGYTGKVHYARHHAGGKNIFGVGFDLNLNSIYSDASEFFKAGHYQANITIDYLRKIPVSNGRISLYAGAQFQSNNGMVFWDGADAFSYIFNHSLNAAGSATYRMDERQFLKMNLSVPLVGWLVRPPHAGFDKTTFENRTKPLKLATVDGTASSFGNYTAIDWNTEYHRKINEKFDLKIGYGLNVQRTFSDEKLIRFNNQITVGITKKF